MRIQFKQSSASTNFSCTFIFKLFSYVYFLIQLLQTTVFIVKAAYSIVEIYSIALLFLPVILWKGSTEYNNESSIYIIFRSALVS